jgi:hypothetical protein
MRTGGAGDRFVLVAQVAHHQFDDALEALLDTNALGSNGFEDRGREHVEALVEILDAQQIS